MPELSQQERLQLSLLDRLADDQRSQLTESRDKRVISVAQLRQLVQRDLTVLLSTISAASCIDLTNYSDVASSTLNYGIADLIGDCGSVYTPTTIELEILKAIKRYEPRISCRSLKVKVTRDQSHMNNHAVTFEISGELWAQPVPLQLFLKTDIDLAFGSVHYNNWQ